MTDPDDSRDICPRTGSPLWLYMVSVTVAGLSVLGVAVARLPLSGLTHLLGQPLFWVVAGLALVADVRPIVIPGRSHPDSATAALTFCFAAFLYWGFPAAALLRSATTLAAALVGRHAIFRAAFNMAQFTLGLGAAGLVLSAAGTHPQPRRHPRLGTIMPADFIPVNGQSCLMRDVTAYVVDAALAQAARWRQDGLLAQVSVNLSARDLLDAGLAGTVGRGLRRHGLLPGELMLEINEAVLADEAPRRTGVLAALAELGIPLSIDGFGTGYSSLIRLRRLPVSEIKIDASVISRLFDGPDNELIVRSLVDLVRALGIRSVAEGVESADVAGALATMGCDAAQGRYYCGPLDPAAATGWLADHLRPAAAARAGASGR